MLADILYFLKAALFVIGLVFVLMIPFFGYLYWLNNKQNRYFKKLESFKLDVTGKEIKYWCTPMQKMNANTFTQLQYHAK